MIRVFTLLLGLLLLGVSPASADWYDGVMPLRHDGKYLTDTYGRRMGRTEPGLFGKLKVVDPAGKWVYTIEPNGSVTDRSGRLKGTVCSLSGRR